MGIVPTTDHPCLFWWALALTVFGAALTFAATVRVGYVAVGERKRFRHRLEEGRRIVTNYNAGLRRVAEFKRFMDSPLLSPERREHPRGYPIPGDEIDDSAVKRKYEAQFRAAMGRGMAEGTSWDDLLLIPEHTALAITNDQIEELKGPALLVATGVLVSTVGSVLSLWV